MAGQPYLTVYALTKYIKKKFDADPHLQEIYVKGEISNYKRHSSGHMYFTLKDEKSRILAVMFSSYNKGMKFEPENGMKVLIRGEISVYESSGQYQIYVKELNPDGVGDLFLAYEQLKERLEQEGLFKPIYKKTFPAYPDVIGVVTSPTGAAVRDIITTIKRRYPIGKIIIFPALVQGEHAPVSISSAIQKAGQMKEIDVLIVGRGGGSIEELWAFNDERVARAIFQSDIPIISAVGHETDYTIADFVADMRAPTPTGAAEIAVPHIDDLLERILHKKIRLMRSLKEKVEKDQTRLARLDKSYVFRFPHRLYEQKYEKLDYQVEKLNKLVEQAVVSHHKKLMDVSNRLVRNSPKRLIQDLEKDYSRLQKRLQNAMVNQVQKHEKEFSRLITHLQAVNPLKIMNRGYSLIYHEGKITKSVVSINNGDLITVQMQDGNLICCVDHKKELEEQ